MRLNVFRICGLAGLVLGICTGVALTVMLGLSLWVLGLLTLVAVATFLALAMATKIVLGREVLVYYHHQLAILAAVASVLSATGQPVLPYLDVTILGVGVFLACGRVGCFLVGCCHGRPHPLGVRYGREHAEAGFPCDLVGVPVFPVQLVEAVWVLLVVAVGTGFLLVGAAPGQALAWYVVAYGAGRFGFEFLRGDVSRVYVAGFSEAQWTSLVLTLGVLAAGTAGAWPLRAWHVAAPILAFLAMIWVTVRRRHEGATQYPLLDAKHISELAETVRRLTSPTATDVPGASQHTGNVVRTSRGLQLSTGLTDTGEGRVRHYTMSRPGDPLAHGEARVLGTLLTLLTDPRDRAELVRGGEGVFHLLIPQH